MRDIAKSQSVKNAFRRTSTVLIYFFLFAGSFVMIFPFLWMILSAFKPLSEIVAYPPTILPQEPTLENIIYVWKNVQFEVFFRNSVFITAVRGSIIIYTSCLAGYVLAKIPFRLSRPIFIFILATMMLPFPVIILPRYQMMVWFKWLDTFHAVIWTGVLNSFGIFMMRQFTTTLPTELVESARIDGANEFSIFHRIIFPLLAPAISALSIFIFLIVWTDFLWPFLVLTTEKHYTVPVGLALFKGREYDNHHWTLAGSTIAIIPVVIIYLILQKRFVEGIALTGLKG